MNNKKKYGQYYTTNCDYILKDFVVPKKAKLIEPFVGQGDLVKWSKRNDWELYDLDPKINAITQNTLLNPPEYHDKFVITNPPFLAKNKNKDKSIYNKYNVGDLYKAAIKTFILGNVAGGILIVPLNFLCDRDKALRNLFFEKYSIDKVSVFEETVFEDTSYTVCAFSFERKKFNGFIDFTFYPDNQKSTFFLDKKGGWSIGSEVFAKTKEKSNYSLSRLIKGDSPSTNIYLHAIDTGSEQGRIKLIPNHSLYYDETENKSERCFATITCNIKINDENLICQKFNEELEIQRKKYKSLFLTNYRNSTKSYARKRISFKQCYNLLEKILLKYN